MNQLEKDLLKQINSKLIQWQADSFALYEMAEIYESAGIGIIHCLARSLATALATLDCPEEYAAKLLTEYMSTAKKRGRKIVEL